MKARKKGGQNPDKISSANKSKKLSGAKAQGSSSKNRVYTYGGRAFSLDNEEVQKRLKKNKEEQKERRENLKSKQDSLRSVRMSEMKKKK